MPLNRYVKVSLALLCAGALFAVGFALGSGGGAAQPSPERASSPAARTVAIDSLRSARSIPVLRAKSGAPASSTQSTGATASGSSAAAGSGGSSGGTPSSTTSSPPAKIQPVRRRTTQ